MRMMIECFTWFPFSSLGEPNYTTIWGCFTRKWEGCGKCVFDFSFIIPFFFIPNIYRPEKPTHRNKSYNDDYKITPNDLFHFRHPFVKNSL